MSTPYTEAWLDGPSSTKFYTRTYLPPEGNPKAVIIFIHGFAEHVGRCDEFHPMLAARGVAIFTFDQRGFGRTAQDVANKSPGSSYGKVTWKEQMADIAWAIGHAKKTFDGLSLFLMGHSMGGAEVLGFSSQHSKGQHSRAVSSLTAVIATSPFIKQAHPKPKILERLGKLASYVLPWVLIPIPLKAEDLSHDKAFNDAYLKDPLIKQSGSLKGVSDMLEHGEALLSKYHRRWPNSMPVLICQGTADNISSPEATQAFYKEISAVDKKIQMFDGGFHELQHEPNGVKEQLRDVVVQFIDSHLPSPTATAAAPATAATLATDAAVPSAAGDTPAAGYAPPTTEYTSPAAGYAPPATEYASPATEGVPPAGPTYPTSPVSPSSPSSPATGTTLASPASPTSPASPAIDVTPAPPASQTSPATPVAPAAAPAGPATTAPATTSPATTAPATTSPVTTSPVTTAPATTAPATTSPVATDPVTTVPATVTPAITAPTTTAPATTAPATTSPVATDPVTTVPATVTPATTAPATTAPATTSPVATDPATTTPATTALTSDAAPAGPATSVPKSNGAPAVDAPAPEA